MVVYQILVLNNSELRRFEECASEWSLARHSACSPPINLVFEQKEFFSGITPIIVNGILCNDVIRSEIVIQKYFANYAHQVPIRTNKNFLDQEMTWSPLFIHKNQLDFFPLNFFFKPLLYSHCLACFMITIFDMPFIFSRIF